MIQKKEFYIGKIGQRKMDIKKQIEDWFPNIIGKNFKYYEPENSFDYNCLAFSLDMNTWIWMNENWPKDIPSNLGILSLKLLFELYH